MRASSLFLVLASLVAAAPLDTTKLDKSIASIDTPKDLKANCDGRDPKCTENNIAFHGVNEFEGHLGKQAGIGAQTAGNIAQIEGQKDLPKTLKANGKTLQHDLQGRSPHHDKEDKAATQSGGHREKGGDGRNGRKGGSHDHHGGKHGKLGNVPDLEVDGHSGVGHDRHKHKSSSSAGRARSHGDHEYSLANAIGEDTTLNDLKLETTIGHDKHHHSRGDRGEHEYTLGHIPAKDKTLNNLDADVTLGHGEGHHKRDHHDYTIGPIGGLVVDLSIGHKQTHKRHEGEYELAHVPGHDSTLNNLDLDIDLGHGYGYEHHHSRGYEHEYDHAHVPVGDKTLNDLNLDVDVGHSKHNVRSPQDGDEWEEMEDQSEKRGLELDSRDIVRTSKENGKKTDKDNVILNTDVKLDLNGHRFPKHVVRGSGSQTNEELKQVEHASYPGKTVVKTGNEIETQTHAVQAGGNGVEKVGEEADRQFGVIGSGCYHHCDEVADAIVH